MHKTFLRLGAILAGLAVALGAFGAHKLKELVPPETVSSFQTGVQYQMYHGFGLIIVGMLALRFSEGRMKWAGRFFVGGIVLFSGSLYLLTALKASEQVGLKGVGLLTPVGGVCFIVGWWMLFLGLATERKATG